MKIGIIDYGSGNLHSIQKACEHAAARTRSDYSVSLITHPEALKGVGYIVLPGVGAYGDCMRGLQAIPGMVDALKLDTYTKRKPFLGICVGMQLLSTIGEEHGEHEGLGWIPGKVTKLTPEDDTLKIPHMGWNTLHFDQHHPLFKHVPEESHVYFVHSYHMLPENKDYMIATTDYGGTVTAAVARENIMGVQFHPEKSQQVGLQIIENFLRM